MSLIFYYAPMSTATITDIVLEELGVPCERIKVSIKDGDLKKPEFLKLNPNGKVPTIVHDDMPIWESAAITMYLGEVFGVQKKLYPAPGPQRGRAMTWITWTNVTLGDSVYHWARNTSNWCPEEQRNAKAGEAAEKDIANCLGMLDGALAQQPYLLGSDYSLVDTHVNSFTDWLRFMNIDFAPHKHLNAWSDRCRTRPAYQKVMSASHS